MTTNESQALVRTTSDELVLRPKCSTDTLVERKQAVNEVMTKVMRPGVDYGRIPGCGDKPTLLKPGAEKLNATFGLAPRFEIERRDLPNDHREFQIICTLVSIGTGVAVGQGVGSCSTMESRYRWRRGERTCPECGNAAIIRGRADYGGGWLCFAKKGGCGAKWPDGAQEIEAQPAGRVENPDIADTYNTVLKIAKKRAQVDATLTALGASDLLTQDLEDIGPEAEREAPAPHPEPTRREAPNRERSAPAQSAPREPGEDWIIDMIGRIDEAESIDDLKRLAPQINRMTPSGSHARKACRHAYEQAIAKLGGNTP